MATTRQEAIEQFQSRLTKVISKFINDLAESADDEALYSKMGWIGQDLPRLMSKAAMAAWEASVDVQGLMESEGVATDADVLP